MELVLGVGGFRRKSVAEAQFIILSPLGRHLGIPAVAWVSKLS